MIRTHIASFVIGTVLVGGGAGAATVSQFSGHAQGEASVNAEVESHLADAQDAFARAESFVVDNTEAGKARAEALYAEGAERLAEASADASAQADADAEAGVSTMDQVARTSATLALRLTTSAGAQTERLSGVKDRLIVAIDTQMAATQKLAADKRAELVAVLEGAKASLTATTTTEARASGGTTASGGGTSVAVSGQAGAQTATSGPSVPTAPAPEVSVPTTPAPSVNADGQGQGSGSLSVGGMLPRP